MPKVPEFNFAEQMLCQIIKLLSLDFPYVLLHLIFSFYLQNAIQQNLAFYLNFQNFNKFRQLFANITTLLKKFSTLERKENVQF